MHKDHQLVFLSAKRTPFGTFGGSLRDINPSDLGAVASKAALEQAHIEPERIQHVIMGNVVQSTADAICVARHIGLKARVPQEVPALLINRLCGTGFQVLIEAEQQMLSSETEVALVGGVESMSLIPYIVRGARWGSKMGHTQIEDYLMASLTDTYCGCSMGITAENLAEKFGISRSQADEFAYSSQVRTKKAQEKGLFEEEITPYPLVDKKGSTTFFATDEHPKPNTELESLASLKPVFKKNGTVTPGTASGIVDGAACMVVSTEGFATKNNLRPLGRLVSYASVGVDPKIMGIGPVPAVRKALERAGLSLSQMDLIEVNEAFAPQYLAVEKELGLNREITNVNGGAIAIGHPLAASGTRITAHLLYELNRRKKRYGLGAACIGGGQGIAVVVETF